MRRVACLISCYVMLSTGVVLAQSGSRSSGDKTAKARKPWAKGVSQQQKTTAQGLLGKGNVLFVESKHLEALDAYREALESWDHPAIRFNIARALINLDRPLEAYENIKLAVQYGPAPIPELFEEAKNYERLLQRQIGELTIKCEQNGVTVTVDGQQQFDCPLEKTIKLLPGPHKVVAEKSGFLPFSKDLALLAASPERVDIKMMTLEDASVTRRRWKHWKPWAVVVGGVAVAGLGVTLELLARSTRDGYGADLTDLCSETPCVESDLPDSVRSAFTRAQVEHVSGVSAIAIGGVAFLSGLALVYLNRPRTFLSEAHETSEPGATLLIPTASADSVGAALIHRF